MHFLHEQHGLWSISPLDAGVGTSIIPPEQGQLRAGAATAGSREGPPEVVANRGLIAPASG
jgi:hypothetical protein